MNKAFNFLIVAALLLGAVCIFLITKYVDAKVTKARESAPTKEWVMQDVIVAKEPVTVGSNFTKFNTEVKSMPEDFVPSNAIKTFEELNDMIAMHHIPVGDMLLSPKVGKPTSLPRASAVIPKGKRLVTVGVDDLSAAGFTVKNGDFVDLVGGFDITPDMLEREEPPIGGRLSITFMQRVEVFDIIHGQTAGASNDGDNEGEAGSTRLAQGTTATFLVTPQEAEIILAASEISGQVFMLLRRYDDTEIVEPPSTLHARIAERLTGDLEVEVEETEAPVIPVIEPTRKTVF